MSKQSNLTKKGTSGIHYFITVAIMILFSVLPPIAPITAYGMRIIGVLIGAIYGLSAIGILWGALAAIIGLGIATGDFAGVLASSLGSNLVWGILLMQVMLETMQQEGVSKFFANWILNRKILKGRPWLYSFALLLGVFIIATTNPIASMMLFWNIIYMTCDTFQMELNSKWTQFMILGTCVAAGFGVVSLPIMNNGIVVSLNYLNVTGKALNGVQYLLSVFPVLIICLVIYILLCKYIFKVDVSALEDIDESIVDREALILNTRQKFVLGSFVLLIILLLLPSILPAAWPINAFLKNLGLFGISGLVILFLCFLHIAGKPLMDFQGAAEKGIKWAPVFMTGIILPVTGLLTSQEAGVMAFISSILTPILSGKSPYIFVVILVLIAVILTNLTQNLIIIGLLLPVAYAMSGEVGINMGVITILLTISAHAAFLLPSGCPPSGLMFSNENIKPSFIYKYGGITLLVYTVFVLTAGYLWVSLIFNF